MKNFKKLIKEAHLGNPLNEGFKDYLGYSEPYMGNKGDEVMITNTKKPDGDIPGNWVLEKPDGSAMVDMFFDSKEAARKYAKGKELKLVPGFKEDIEEATDFNDPALIKSRAAQMKRDKIEADEEDKQSYLNKKYGSSFMDKLEAEIDLKNELADLEDEREDVLRNMEEEAEPEGGPIADDYGSILNDMDAKIAAIKSDLDDLRMYESVNEESEGDKEIKALEKEAEKYPKTDSRYMQIQKKIGDLKSDKDYALPGSKADKKFSDMNEDLIKEITLGGGNYQDSYGNNPADDQITTTEDYEIFMEMFPRGEASRILMDPKRKELYNKHLEWTKDNQYNNTFEHMQYHLIQHDGEEYKVHQSQYYNGNYKDFRNPRFTEVMISKDGKRMGTYLVDTEEYIKDLEDLDVQKRVSEGTCGYGEDGKIGDKPAGPIDEESDIDVGGGAKQDDEINLNVSNANDIADEEEAHSGVVGENKEFDFKKMAKEALTPDYLKK
jgi:hypothetical protein